jgi:DNA-directed RNA polymerase specialized sigma24 family protein
MASSLENSSAELSAWYQSLKDGGSRATHQLWEMYFERMVRLARRKLVGAQRLDGDEEDVALSAFKSFCLGFQRGKFVQQGDPENLWPLLVTLTLNKAIDHVRRAQRLKRGGGMEVEPSPELQVAAEESFQQLLDMLDATGDLSLREVLLHSMVGESSPEIAQHLDCTLRTVQRKLQTIRMVWEQANS